MTRRSIFQGYTVSKHGTGISMEFHNFTAFDCFPMVARLNFDFRKFYTCMKLSRSGFVNLESRCAVQGEGLEHLHRGGNKHYVPVFTPALAILRIAGRLLKSESRFCQNYLITESKRTVIVSSFFDCFWKIMLYAHGHTLNFGGVGFGTRKVTERLFLCPLTGRKEPLRSSKPF